MLASSYFLDWIGPPNLWRFYSMLLRRTSQKNLADHDYTPDSVSTVLVTSIYLLCCGVLSNILYNGGARIRLSHPPTVMIVYESSSYYFNSNIYPRYHK